MDALVVALFLATALPNTAILISTERWLNLVVVLLVSTALSFRRDRPVLAFIVVLILELTSMYASQGTVSMGIGVLFMLYSLATTHSPGRTAIAAAAATTVAVIAMLVSSDVSTREPMVFIILSMFSFMAMAVTAGLGAYIRASRNHENATHRWADRTAELASANERNRIAREMHDVIAHSLTVMVALSDGAAANLERDPHQAKDVLGELSRTGRSSIADMRRVLGLLRAEAASEAPEPLPASDSLAHLFAGFRAAGLPLKVTARGPGLPDDPAFQVTVYRILQESLTNVLRYGKAVASVDVTITRVDDTVHLRIIDDGRDSRSPVPSEGLGQGLAGMRERAAIYAGTVTHGRLPSGGWGVTVLLRVP